MTIPADLQPGAYEFVVSREEWELDALPVRVELATSDEGISIHEAAVVSADRFMEALKDGRLEDAYVHAQTASAGFTTLGSPATGARLLRECASALLAKANSPLALEAAFAAFELYVTADDAKSAESVRHLLLLSLAAVRGADVRQSAPDQPPSVVDVPIPIKAFTIPAQLDIIEKPVEMVPAVPSLLHVQLDTFHESLGAFLRSLREIGHEASPRIVAELLAHTIVRTSSNQLTDGTRLIARCLGQLNGLDRGQLGEEIGLQIAADIYSGHLGTDMITPIWQGLLGASASNRESQEANLPLRFLGGYTRYLAGQSWKRNPKELWEAIDKVHEVRPAAERVVHALHRQPMFEVVLAVSEFHEDRILAMLAQTALENSHAPILCPASRKWGGLGTRDRGEAHMGLQNDGGRDEELGHAIYRFHGYYAFARRSWLESIDRLPNGTPRVVLESLPELLGDALSQSGSDVTARRQADARAWLAVKGGLHGGFPELKDPLLKAVRRVNRKATAGRYRPTPESFGGHLESFLRGEVDVFLGGAVHARLLRRWWCAPVSDMVVELLSPSHFAALMPREWPPNNRLAFGNSLRKGHGSLKKAFNELYHHLGQTLDSSARAYGGNTSARKVLFHLMATLALPSQVTEEPTWSLVTHEGDMVELLTKDDVFA